MNKQKRKQIKIKKEKNKEKIRNLKTNRRNWLSISTS